MVDITCTGCGEPVDEKGAVGWLTADGWDGTFWHPACALKDDLTTATNEFGDELCVHGHVITDGGCYDCGAIDPYQAVRGVR